MENTANEMAKVKADMTEALAVEKRRLIVAIGARMADDDAFMGNSTGMRGRIPDLPGMWFFNCNRAGKPSARVGRGVNGLAHYFWIPAVYRDGDLEHSYVLSLCREDVDVTTGNVHTDFTRLQMTRLGHDGPEVGGQANPTPERIDVGWRIDYLADESFPRAARCCAGATVDADERPWGYGGFEGRIPVLDMADPAYDPGTVADFFLQLIARDVREHNAIDNMEDVLGAPPDATHSAGALASAIEDMAEAGGLLAEAADAMLPGSAKRLDWALAILAVALDCARSAAAGSR